MAARQAAETPHRQGRGKPRIQGRRKLRPAYRARRQGPQSWPVPVCGFLFFLYIQKGGFSTNRQDEFYHDAEEPDIRLPALPGETTHRDAEQQDFLQWLFQKPTPCKADFREDVSLLRNLFRRLGLLYREFIPEGSDAYAFEITETGRNSFRIRIYLEKEPRVCRIDAVYPFYAEEAFTYPLCTELIKENYSRRFGCLKYDETDGELMYQYAFRIPEGLREREFRENLASVLVSATSCFDGVKKYALGRFRKKERQDVICNAQTLIMELGT